jgi:hypothetical protein
MATVDNLWLAALTRDENDAGSPDRFNLTISIDGVDSFDQDFSIGWHATAQGEVQGGLRQGQAGLQEAGPLSAPFAVNALTNSSVRLGIRGDNAWGPEHVLLIGRTQPALEPGRIIALAMETDLTEWLSADSSEGHLTTRLRLVGVGSSTTLIRRVLLLVYTDTGNDVQTDNTIQLQIGTATSLVLNKQLTDDFNQYTAKWFYVDVLGPFTRGDLALNGSIRLSILGTNAWLPKSLFLFGLDTETGRPNEVVCLSAVPVWDMGWLSADPHEGSQSVDLSLSA